jgi:hypothetical protein
MDLAFTPCIIPSNAAAFTLVGNFPRTATCSLLCSFCVLLKVAGVTRRQCPIQYTAHVCCAKPKMGVVLSKVITAVFHRFFFVTFIFSILPYLEKAERICFGSMFRWISVTIMVRLCSSAMIAVGSCA